MKTPLLKLFAAAMAACIGMSASAQVIDLFDATPITNSGFAPDIGQTFVYDSADVTLFCEGAATATIQTVGGGNPLVDNYMTAGDDLVSICSGGNPNLGGGSVTGTNCFTSGTTNSAYWGDPIDTQFTSNATASVALADGLNEFTVKLWDWGGVYGNTALELVIPDNCGVPEYVSMCAGKHYDVGDVAVTHNDTNLFVWFEIFEPGWYLAETHVAVGDLPVNKKGNPVPGHFPYACELDGSLQTACMVTIPLDGLSGEVDIAAHASVFQLAGDGCGSDTQYASEVLLNNQALLKNGGTVAANRSDPTAVFYPDDGAPGPYSFFSLGFGGDLTVGFGYPVYNAPGNDVCVQEVTNGRATYPEELADIYADAMFVAGVSNRANGTGLACVDLPADMMMADDIMMVDMTDPNIHVGTADGFDIDWIGACYLYLGDETAWGAACYEGEGDRFVDQGNWGTFFSYTID